MASSTTWGLSDSPLLTQTTSSCPLPGCSSLAHPEGFSESPLPHESSATHGEARLFAQWCLHNIKASSASHIASPVSGAQDCGCTRSGGNENAPYSKGVPTMQGSCGDASQLLYKGRTLWSKPLSFAPVFPWQPLQFVVMATGSSDKQRNGECQGVTPFGISPHTASHSLHHRGTEGRIRKVRKPMG